MPVCVTKPDASVFRYRDPGTTANAGNQDSKPQLGYFLIFFEKWQPSHLFRYPTSILVRNHRSCWMPRPVLWRITNAVLNSMRCFRSSVSIYDTRGFLQEHRLYRCGITPARWRTHRLHRTGTGRHREMEPSTGGQYGTRNGVRSSYHIRRVFRSRPRLKCHRVLQLMLDSHR